MHKMQKLRYLSLDMAEFNIDTIGLAADEIGVYVTLMALAWHSGDGSITGNLEELKNILRRRLDGFHGHTFNRIVPKLLKRHFSDSHNGRLVHLGVANSLQTARKRLANGRQSADKRWSNTRKNNHLASFDPLTSSGTGNSNSKKKESPLTPLTGDGGRKEEVGEEGKEGRKEEVGEREYAFEAGVIRLSQRDLDRWKTHFSYLDVPAELWGLTQWAQGQQSWFFAVSSALAKKNREAKKALEVAKHQNGGEVYDYKNFFYDVCGNKTPKIRGVNSF